MTCLITLRARNGLLQWESDEWTMYVMLGCLSTEPETQAEFGEALRRHLPHHCLLETGTPIEHLEQSASETIAWCLIDLISATVFAGGGCELPDPQGAYEADESDEAEGFPVVWLDLPSYWEFLIDSSNWVELAESRAQAAAERRQFEVRPVLFGKPLLEHLATSVLAAVDRWDESDDHVLMSRIHADWLMASRDDLGGFSPRYWLLAQRSRIARDLEGRAHQWSVQGYPPPPLSVESAAYRFAGFGTTEVVLYFDLVRELLMHALHLTQEKDFRKSELGDQLAIRLEQWLASPLADGSGPESAGQFIESERRRMPVTSDGTHLDCDCPICHSEAINDFGPTFMWFDGHHLELEDEFAFSLTESRQEWEQDRADVDVDVDESESFSELDADDQQAGELETSAEDTEDPFASVWKSCFESSRTEDVDRSRDEGALAIGFRLAELVDNVKMRSPDRSFVETLNNAYRNFRGAQSAVAIHSAAEQLCEHLEVTANDFPDLVSQSADLQSKLREVLRASASDL